MATGSRPLSWVVGSRMGNSDCGVTFNVSSSPELTNVFYGKVKVWLQRELKANRLNLRLLSISHVDHIIRRVFRCDKRKEKSQGPSGDGGTGYKPRHVGELNTEKVQREGSPWSLRGQQPC